jgi:bacterioferritin-associated ferredoxin
MMTLTHIIASGTDKSLCGLENVEGTSLGFGCNCQKCLDKAREIIQKHNEGGKNNEN